MISFNRKNSMGLLPCPFCGNVNVKPWINTDYNAGNHLTVVCSIHNRGCGASCGYTDNEDTAKEKWNQRATSLIINAIQNS